MHAPLTRLPFHFGLPHRGRCRAAHERPDLRGNGPPVGRRRQLADRGRVRHRLAERVRVRHRLAVADRDPDGVAEPERLAGLVATILKSRDLHLKQGDAALIARTIPYVRDGAKTTLELADAVLFALKARPLELPEKTRAQLAEAGMRDRFVRLRRALDGAADWSVPGLEDALRKFAEAEGVGLGKFGPQLRSVLAGGASAKFLLQRAEGILSLRGRWFDWRSSDETLALPALPTLHPAFLLRQPAAKKRAWQDLMMLVDRLDRPERPA